MPPSSLYDDPELYDRLTPPGPCAAFYDSVIPAGASVLELGCGTGRLTLSLASQGRRVTGLDQSPAMLAAARRKAGLAGVDVTWIAGDMAGFDLGRRFDAIVVSCNSLGHLTTPKQLQGCLSAVRDHLAPDGLFAFDIVNPQPRELGRPTLERRRRAPEGLRLREEVRYDPVSRVRAAHWRVHDRDGSVTEVDLNLRQFFPDEAPALLAQAGLMMRERYGEFDRSRFTARSRLQVCLAERA
jgi:SAM-dependent methyltransferase